MKKGYSKAALFLASQAVTLLGSSIVQFAIIWYVTLETSSGGWVAMISAAKLLYGESGVPRMYHQSREVK